MFNNILSTYFDLQDVCVYLCVCVKNVTGTIPNMS